jgi:hypothetical protein
MRCLVVALVLTAACTSDDAPANADAAAGNADAPAGACSAETVANITLTTDDGVDLVADSYTTGTVGDPGVILLHMIPPGNSKANYPATFIDPLVARGFNVINVNRRGAPGSGGTATEAYLGPNGKFDAKAGYDYLVAHACATPAASIAVVGASNGTTTTVDFSVYAASEASVEQPAALVFLSGGAYTESQNTISGNIDALDDHPIWLGYPTAEAAWNLGVEAIAPQTWQFTEYSPGSHGTLLFGSDSDSITDVIDFLDGVL